MPKNQTVYEVTNFHEANVAIDKIFDYFDANENLELSLDPTWIEAMLETENNIIDYYQEIIIADEDQPYYDEAIKLVSEAMKNIDAGLSQLSDENAFVEADFCLHKAFESILKINNFYEDRDK